MVKHYTNLIPCSEDDSYWLSAIRAHVEFHQQWGTMTPESRTLFVADAIEATKGGDIYENNQ